MGAMQGATSYFRKAIAICCRAVGAGPFAHNHDARLCANSLFPLIRLPALNRPILKSLDATWNLSGARILPTLICIRQKSSRQHIDRPGAKVFIAGCCD